MLEANNAAPQPPLNQLLDDLWPLAFERTGEERLKVGTRFKAERTRAEISILHRKSKYDCS